MSGRRLEPGEHGEITYAVAPKGGYVASCYYRNWQGVRRRLEATAPSKTAAKRDLLAKLEKVLAVGGSGKYDVRTTFGKAAEDWFADIKQKVADGRRSPGTADTYRSTLDNHVLPAIGDLRLSELTVPLLDQFVHGKRESVGYSTAKLCRSVTSGVCGYAVRKGGTRTNLVRDIAAIEQDQRDGARAMTVAEVRGWLAILDADERACAKDLPDLVRFMLGTGCRIGEALGVRWADLDLTGGVVWIRRTVIRVKGQGLVAKPPKTRSGERILPLPTWLVVMLEERREVRNQGPVFPDSLGGYRDPRNTERAHREARMGTAYEWVIPHTYRKTVATLMDGDGRTARSIADQLGHSRVSMTQDVYLGRRAVEESAPAALEGLIEEPGGDDDGDDDPDGLALAG